jgi:hypothetical protein
MYPAKGPPTPQRSGFAQSLDGVANVLAIIATFFIAPMLFQVSIGAVQDFTTNQYGPAWLNITTLVWAIIKAAVIYWTVRGVATEFLLKRGINNLIR